MEVSEENFISLFTLLLSNSNQNKEEICENLQEMIKNTDSLNILISLLTNPNKSIAKCAAIFLNRCIIETKDELSESDAATLFQELIQIFSTSESYISMQLIYVLDELGCMFDSNAIIFSFIQQLFDTNDFFHSLCLCTLKSLSIEENIDLVLHIIDNTIRSDDYDIEKACISVAGIAFSKEFEEEKKNALTELVTSRFIEVIAEKNEEFVGMFCELVQCGFVDQYKTISLEQTFPVLREAIVGDFSPRIKYCSLLTLYNLLEIFDPEMSEEETIELLDQAIEGSISLYDESVDFNEQLADGGASLMIKLLENIPFENAKEYILQRISDLCEVNEIPQYLISVVLMNVGIERSKNMLVGNYATIFQVLFTMLSEGNDILKNCVISFLLELYRTVDIGGLQEEEIPFSDYIECVFSLVGEGGFINALRIVPHLIDSMESADEIFGDVLEKVMSFTDCDQIFIMSCTYNILFSLIDKSNEYVKANIDGLIEIMKQSICLHEIPHLIPYILNCIIKILNAYPERVMQEMELLLDATFKGLESEDILDFNYGAKLLLSVLSYDESILSEIWENIITVIFSHDISNTSERFESGEIDMKYVSLCVTPSFEILTILVRCVEEITENEELTNKLYDTIRDDITNLSQPFFMCNAVKIYTELTLHQPENENVGLLKEPIINFIIGNPGSSGVLRCLSRLVVNLGVEFLEGAEDSIIESIMNYAGNLVNKVTEESTMKEEFAEEGSRFFRSVLIKVQEEKVSEFYANYSEALLSIATRKEYSMCFSFNVIKTFVDIGAFPNEHIQPVIEMCMQSMGGVCLVLMKSLIIKFNEIAADLSQFVFQYFIDHHNEKNTFINDNLVAIISLICIINDSLFDVPGIHEEVLSYFPIRSDFTCNPQAMLYLVRMQNHINEGNIRVYCQAIARSYAKNPRYFQQLMIPQEVTPTLIGFLIRVSQANGGTQFLLSLLEDNQQVLNNLLLTISSLK